MRPEKIVRPSIWISVATMALALVALSGSLLPAYAHWQNTKWGMTLPQAKSAIKSIVEDCTSDRRGCFYRFPYSSGELNFNGTMSFEAGHLSEVTLFPKSDTDTGDILRALTTKYGTPHNDNDGDLHSSIWRATEDVVTLFWINPFGSGRITGVYVSYKPLLKTNASGL